MSARQGTLSTRPYATPVAELNPPARRTANSRTPPWFWAPASGLPVVHAPNLAPHHRAVAPAARCQRLGVPDTPRPPAQPRRLQRCVPDTPAPRPSRVPRLSARRSARTCCGTLPPCGYYTPASTPPSSPSGSATKALPPPRSTSTPTSRSRTRPGPHRPDRRHPRPLPAHRHDHRVPPQPLIMSNPNTRLTRAPTCPRLDGITRHSA